MKASRAVSTVLLISGLLAAPFCADAQLRTNAPRVGVMAGGGSAFDAGFESFRQRLRELGYVEDRTLSLIVRNAEGRTERYREHAAELVGLRVDAIVVQGNAPLVALKQATQTIPIVMASIGDPVGAGFVDSLAKPGGNITGLSNMAEGVSAKWVELVRDVVPKATRVAVLWDSRNSAHGSMWREIQKASHATSLTAIAWELQSEDDIGRGFSAMRAEKVDAVIILPHPVAGANRRRILALATQHRLPTIYPFREFAEAGGLLTYGPNVADMWRRAADFLDKILKGAKPTDLPVAQPTKFELVINIRTARTLGLTLSPALLLRADEVIQ